MIVFRCEIVSDNMCLPQRNGVRLEKIKISQLISKISKLCEPQVLLPCSQQPPLDPGRTRYTSFTTFYPIPCRFILVLSFHLHINLPYGHVSSCFPPEILRVFSSPYVLHAVPMSQASIRSS